MKKAHIGTELAAWLRRQVPDTFIVAGAGMVTYGAMLVYEPAGYIVGGVLLMAIGLRALVAS